MTDAPSNNTPERPLTRDILYVLRYYLGNRRALYVLAGMLILGGIALNWGWLVAAEIAPVLITLLPCAVMCALGLCMHKMAGGDKAVQHNVISSGTNMQADTRHAQAEVADSDERFGPVSQAMLPAATAIASVHQGYLYNFESRANRDAFECDPEKFLAASQVSGQQIGSSGQPSYQSKQRDGCR